MRTTPRNRDGDASRDEDALSRGSRKGAVLTLADVEVRYGSLVAVDTVSLTVSAGQVLAVTGPSGAGKTSLLWLMAGALEPDRGTVLVDGVPVGRRPQAAARGVAVVPQGNGLAAVLTAYENIVVPLLDGGLTPAEADTRAREALEVVGLEDRAEHLVEELSGGQQQRVAVARALLPRPDVIFADEPTGNLDSRAGHELLDFLRRSVRELGQTVVMVTHDPVAASFADRVVMLVDGRLAGEILEPSAETVLEALKKLGE
jgi:putative ABC transport system ATP-binding protein